MASVMLESPRDSWQPSEQERDFSRARPDAGFGRNKQLCTLCGGHGNHSRFAFFVVQGFCCTLTDSSLFQRAVGWLAPTVEPVAHLGSAFIAHDVLFS